MGPVARVLIALLAAGLIAPGRAAWAGAEGCSQYMETTDERFSVQAVVHFEVRFADIGCAMLWRSHQCTRDQMIFDSGAEGRDYLTGEPVNLSAAFFVVGPGIESPMGSGMAALRRLEDAGRLSAGGAGEVMTYDRLIRRKPFEDADKGPAGP